MSISPEKTENFFGLLKSELLYLREFESFEEFREELENTYATTIIIGSRAS
jgi:hypothetical protein